jgi:uncharacterized phage protein (TIGR01671 family)
MREIKFRGKSIADGKWVYGLPQQLIEIHGVVNLNKQAEIGYIVSYEPERMLQSHAPDNSLYWYEIDNKTLGQFTGLLDKNGKKIYEGDIVEMNCLGWGEPYKEMSCVVWANYRWWFQMLNKDSTGHIRLEWLENKWQREIEVIGNIYENAQLLEEKPE